MTSITSSIIIPNIDPINQSPGQCHIRDIFSDVTSTENDEFIATENIHVIAIGTVLETYCSHQDPTSLETTSTKERVQSHSRFDPVP